MYSIHHDIPEDSRPRIHSEDTLIQVSREDIKSASIGTFNAFVQFTQQLFNLCTLCTTQQCNSATLLSPSQQPSAYSARVSSHAVPTAVTAAALSSTTLLNTHSTAMLQAEQLEVQVTARQFTTASRLAMANSPTRTGLKATVSSITFIRYPRNETDPCFQIQASSD